MISMALSTKLKQYRMEVDVVQDDFALAVGIRGATFSAIERGKRCSYTTAKKILDVLNMYRGNRSLPPIGHVEELGLTIV
jgi:DNA-binding XRE family transcriptional regulator